MELPADVGALFETPSYAHLATAPPGSGPRTVPVWAGIEDGKIAFLTSPGSRKARSLAADPPVAISVTGPGNPYAMAQVRGRVTAAWTASRPGTSSTGSPAPAPASVTRCAPAASCSLIDPGHARDQAYG